MTKFVQDAKKATMNMVCKEHQKKAEISISGDTIEFKTCCQKFKDEITKATKQAVVDSGKQQISDMAKRF